MRDWNSILLQLGCNQTNAAVWSDLFGYLDDRYPNPLELQQIVPQFLHETGRLANLDENLNYSAQALVAVFGTHRITQEQAQEVGRVDGAHRADPRGIANIIYGGEWGQKNLGNRPGTEDGWMYRGSGLIQVTGLYNFQVASQEVGYDFVADPDHMRVPCLESLQASCAWWDKNITLDMLTNHVAIRKKVNTKMLGLDDTQALFAKSQTLIV